MQTNTNQYLVHLQADFEWFEGQPHRGMQQSGLLYLNKELLVWVETHKCDDQTAQMPIMREVYGWSDVTPSLPSLPSLTTGVPVYKVNAYWLNRIQLRNYASSNKTLYIVWAGDDGEDEDMFEKCEVEPGHTCTYPYPMQLDESGGYAAFHVYDENKNIIGKLNFVTE